MELGDHLNCCQCYCILLKTRIPNLLLVEIIIYSVMIDIVPCFYIILILVYAIEILKIN